MSLIGREKSRGRGLVSPGWRILVDETVVEERGWSRRRQQQTIGPRPQQPLKKSPENGVGGKASCKFSRPKARCATCQQRKQNPTTPGQRTIGVPGLWLFRHLEAPLVGGRVPGFIGGGVERGSPPLNTSMSTGNARKGPSGNSALLDLVLPD